MHSCFFPLRRVPLFSSFRNDVIIKIYVITLLYYLFIYLFTSYAAILIIYLSRKDALFFVILIILIPIFWHLREATLRFLFVFLFFFCHCDHHAARKRNCKSSILLFITAYYYHCVEMRHRRKKVYRKYLRFYKVAFGLVPPFTVLADGNFIHAVTAKNIDFEEHLSRILDVEKSRCTVATTGSVCDELNELAAENPSFAPSKAAASRLKKLKLGGGKGQNTNPSESILKLVGQRNRHKYVVATQDPKLQAALRKIPGVPIVFCARTMLILEAPSDASNAAFEKNETKKLAPRKEERRSLHSIAEGGKAKDENSSKKRKRKKGPKQPNPLSVKKKVNKSKPNNGKPTATVDEASQPPKKAKRARKRKRKHGGSGGEKEKAPSDTFFSATKQ